MLDKKSTVSCILLSYHRSR